DLHGLRLAIDVDGVAHAIPRCARQDFRAKPGCRSCRPALWRSLLHPTAERRPRGGHFRGVTMKAKRWGIVGGIVVAGAVLAWALLQPGPMAFAKGKRVSLAEYDGNPTGVPADFP